MVPSMGKLLTETERVRFLGNFLVAAGEEERAQGLGHRHLGPAQALELDHLGIGARHRVADDDDVGSRVEVSGGENTSVHPMILYAYDVNGRTYQSSQLRPGDSVMR